jgi:uncharacterized protein YbjT (DUF2867 family)
MYAVLGATGNTGRVVAEELLRAGRDVRVVGRDVAKLQPLVDRGARAVVGFLDDPHTLAEAFAGAQAVYVMIPPDRATPDPLGVQRRHGEAIAGALREMRVRQCVNLSSVGAQNRAGAGPVSGLALQEERLDAIPDLDVLHLRPGMFMENLYEFLPMIKQGFIASPLQADLPLPWIATRDIGAVAAAELLRLEFQGHVRRELHGPRDLTWNDITPVVGKAIGNPNLRYMQVPYEDANQGMVQAGLQPALAESYVEMYRAMNEKRLRPVEPRSARTTTATTIEAFVAEFAAAIA